MHSSLFLARLVNLYYSPLPEQELVLQFLYSMLFPAHSVPLYIEAWVFVLLLSWEPPPQVTEQLPHELHELQIQLIGQRLVLQFLYAMLFPVHSVPPY